MTQGQQLAVIAEAVTRIEHNQEEAAKLRENMINSLYEQDRKLDDLSRRMAAVEPVTQMVTSWHARLIGAAMILGFLGTIVGMGWVLLKDRADNVWHAIWGL